MSALLGQITTLTYLTNQTLVTNLGGYVTTLNFTTGDALSSAIDVPASSPPMRGIRFPPAREHRWWPGDAIFLHATLPTAVQSQAAVIQPLGGAFSYTYNGAGQLASLIDQLGNPYNLVLEQCRLHQRGTDAQGNGTSFTYNSLGVLTAVQNPLGQTVSQVYNSLGQRTAIVSPLGQRLSFTYNANGLVQTIQDPLGAITTILRDQVNRVTTRIDAPRKSATRSRTTSTAV